MRLSVGLFCVLLSGLWCVSQGSYTMLKVGSYTMLMGLLWPYGMPTLMPFLWRPYPYTLNRRSFS